MAWNSKCPSISRGTGIGRQLDLDLPADVLQLIWDTVWLDVRTRLKAWAWKELHIELKARIVETMFRKYKYT